MTWLASEDCLFDQSALSVWQSYITFKRLEKTGQAAQTIYSLRCVNVILAVGFAGC